MNNNSILAIYTFFNGLWVFNDPRVGLIEEPFVSGADEFLEYALTKKNLLDEGKKGFVALFAKLDFPGHDYKLIKVSGEPATGTWYRPENTPDFKGSFEGKLWLCPAMNLYFPEAQDAIYFQIKPSL